MLLWEEAHASDEFRVSVTQLGVKPPVVMPNRHARSQKLSWTASLNMFGQRTRNKTTDIKKATNGRAFLADDFDSGEECMPSFSFRSILQLDLCILSESLLYHCKYIPKFPHRPHFVTCFTFVTILGSAPAYLTHY